MKGYIKKGIAISLSVMLVFEMFPILPFHFVSYAEIGEEEISNVEIMESRGEIKSEEDNENVSRSSESDFVIDKNGVLVKYLGNDEKVEVPKGVTSIKSRAFSGYTNLTEIILPEGITNIGDWAFYKCSNLTKITLPEGITSIGDSAFDSCKSLTEVILPEGITSIGNQTFLGCESLREIILPKGITSIGNHAFYGCKSLTEIILLGGITSIGDYAFYNCSNLTKIILPEKVMSIGEHAFSNCKNLTEITLPNKITRIEEGTFSGCINLIEIILPEGITSIGEWAFSQCCFLTEITLPKGVISIGNVAFYECYNLREITLPEGITSIGDRTFCDCSSLREITLPNGITNIGDVIFEECRELTKIILPKEIVWIEKDAFSGCDNLTIYCYANSYAEKYAKENNIPYQLIDDGDEVEEVLVSSFSIDSTAMGTLDSAITVKGTLVLKEDVETSSSILSSEVEKISWMSSDSSIAEVTDWSSESEEDNRKAALQICVTPYQEGRVTITGKTSNGLTASCEVMISKGEEMEEKEASVTLEIGENAEIYVKGEGKVRDSVTITGSAWEIEGKIYTTLEELEKKCDKPERDSYRFEGWELEGKKLSENSPILDGSRLSAVWIKVKNDSENNNNNSSSSSSGSKTKGNRIINEDTAGCYNLSKTEIFSLCQGVSTILGKDTQIGLVIKNEEGIMAVSEEGDIVLRKNSGSMAEKEWMFVEGAWYYFGSDKKAVSGWIQNEGGKWYYLNPESKKMETGWVEMADGKWYYLDKENGEMRTGWKIMEEGNWYFMNPKTGEMMTGWICVEEKYYYLDETGVCAMNMVTPDGYRVDETGMWIK